MTTRLSGGTFTPFLGGIPNLWRNALCDTDAPPPNPPAFTGGQCPVDYNVTGTYNYQILQGGSCNNRTAQFQVVIRGPVRYNGLVITPVNESSSTAVAEFTSGTGQTIRPNGVSFSPSCNQPSVSGLSVVRVDGLLDNCGNPEPDYPPLTPPDVTIPRDVPYTNSDGIDVTIPVVFVFARATIDVDANVTIPFTLNLSPTLNITGTVNVDGTVNFNFGGGTATTLPKDPRKGDCGDIALPDGEVPEDPTDSDKDPQKDRDREEVIKGVLVTVTSLSNERASLIIQSDNPDIYAPSLGHVQFLCRVGDTSAAWTSDQPVKNRRNLVPCPWADGAIAVRGTPQPGVTWELTPIVGYAGLPVEYVQ